MYKDQKFEAVFYTKRHRAELLHQVSSGRASAPTSNKPYQAEPPHQRQPGLLGQSLHTNVNQVSSGRASIPTPTRPHQAGPRHRVSMSKSSISMSTMPHRAEPVHQTSPGGASAPGLIGQSFRNDVNQALSGRASTPTPTRSHWAESPYQHHPGLMVWRLYPMRPCWC